MQPDIPRIQSTPELEADTRRCVTIHDSAARGRLTVFRKPASPDPFVNAQMTPVGADAQGVERFFISCINSITGPTSFLIAEDGTARSYPWPQSDIRCIYSVAPENHDVLWLGGGSTFVRLVLSSGHWDAFPVEGLGFITAGMALDPATGKLFGGAQFALVSFDTHRHEAVRVYRGQKERSPDNHHFDHWRLPDGSYGFILQTPGLSFLRWDPQTETVNWKRLADDAAHPSLGLVRKLGYVDQGRLYVPHFGWLDGLTGEIAAPEHPPEQEACWLGRRGDTVYGVQSDRLNACASVVAWDLTSGRITPLFTVPDTDAGSCALTRGGKMVLVDVYGVFRRFDLDTGALELTRSVESYGQHRCNAIVPAGKGRVLGAPFISQNFWQFDTRKDEGFYAGRVGGSAGQCDYAVRVAGKVYFAIYGGGQLTEYDPDKPAGFPRNPRVVARTPQGQHGAGITTDGRIVWVAFKARYGTLDGAMIRYDTATGAASYRNAAMPGQTILTPMYDAGGERLVAASTYLSDCSTAAPVHDRVFAVILDPVTLAVTAKVECPEKAEALVNHGPLDPQRWLMQARDRLFVFDAARMSLTPFAERPVAPDETAGIASAGTPGHFLIQIRDTLYSWFADTDTLTPFAAFETGFVRRWWMHGTELTFDCGRYAALWSGWTG